MMFNFNVDTERKVALIIFLGFMYCDFHNLGTKYYQIQAITFFLFLIY